MAHILGFGSFNDIDTHVQEPFFNALDGDLSKVRPIDPEQDDGCRIGGIGRYEVGRPVHPDNMPTRVRREGAGLKIYPKQDFHQLRGTPIMSTAARDLIEDMEPGVHQFFPIEVTLGKDDAPYGTYYKFYTGSRIDTLDRSRSGPYTAAGLCTAIGDPEGRLVLDSERIGNHHIWCEKYVALPGWVWASDAMVARLQASGLTGLKPTRHVPETKDL
ncbi:MAG: hypothetical protein HLUCCA08_15405 [Rhodobacteraceae bacterium HLUCCA08]|nr:MAG: hypothetical protein HLUCCA08_15405 [Rhodobacteraceae bacterium HLUCCA08]